MRWLDAIIDSMYMILSKLWEIEEDRRAWHAAVHGVSKSRHAIVTKQQLNQHIKLLNTFTSFLPSPLPTVDAKEPQNPLLADIKGTEGNSTSRSITHEKSGGFSFFLVTFL